MLEPSLGGLRQYLLNIRRVMSLTSYDDLRGK